MKQLRKSTTGSRIAHIIIGFTGLACINSLSLQMAQADEYDVEINKTQMVHLDRAAAAVVIGNPEIADVSVHSPNLLFVVGRGFGTTNLIVLDDLGQTVLNETVRVKRSLSPSTRRILTVGSGWESYECTPICQAAPVQGDDPRFVSRYAPKGQAINNSGVPATVTPFTSAGGPTNTSPISFAYSPNQSPNGAPAVSFSGVPSNPSGFPFPPPPPREDK